MSVKTTFIINELFSLVKIWQNTAASGEWEGGGEEGLIPIL